MPFFRTLALVLATAAAWRARAADAVQYVVTFDQASLRYSETANSRLQLVVVGSAGRTPARTFKPTGKTAGSTTTLTFTAADVGDVRAVRVLNPDKDVFCLDGLRVVADGAVFDDCEDLTVCVADDPTWQNGAVAKCADRFSQADACADDGKAVQVAMEPEAMCGMAEYEVSFAQASLPYSRTIDTELSLVVVGADGTATVAQSFAPPRKAAAGTETKLSFVAADVGAVAAVKVRNPDANTYCFDQLHVTVDGAQAFKDCTDKVVCVGNEPTWKTKCQDRFGKAAACANDGSYVPVAVKPDSACAAPSALQYWAESAVARASAVAGAYPRTAATLAGAAVGAAAVLVVARVRAARKDITYMSLP